MFTLDEAIIYYGMLARRASIDAAQYENLTDYSSKCKEDADKFDQLYRWLSELREYRNKKETT